MYHMHNSSEGGVIVRHMTDEHLFNFLNLKLNNMENLVTQFRDANNEEDEVTGDFRRALAGVTARPMTSAQLGKRLRPHYDGLYPYLAEAFMRDHPVFATIRIRLESIEDLEVAEHVKFGPIRVITMGESAPPPRRESSIQDMLMEVSKKVAHAMHTSETVEEAQSKLRDDESLLGDLFDAVDELPHLDEDEMDMLKAVIAEATDDFINGLSEDDREEMEGVTAEEINRIFTDHDNARMRDER